jgi:hypothetical protein
LQRFIHNSTTDNKIASLTGSLPTAAKTNNREWTTAFAHGWKTRADRETTQEEMASENQHGRNVLEAQTRSDVVVLSGAGTRD